MPPTFSDGLQAKLETLKTENPEKYIEFITELSTRIKNINVILADHIQ